MNKETLLKKIKQQKKLIEHQRNICKDEIRTSYAGRLMFGKLDAMILDLKNLEIQLKMVD